MPITDTRKLLTTLETDRKNLLQSLSKLESQIYEFEGSYLRETGAYGNAVKVCVHNAIVTFSISTTLA